MALKGKGKKKFKISPLLVIGGIAIVGIGAFVYSRFLSPSGSGFGGPITPSLFPPTGGQGPLLPNIFPPAGQNPYIDPYTNTPIPLGTVLGQSTIQPSLSQMQQPGIIPYQQNIFCDPTLGLNWDPLQGKCVQQLQGRNGQCAPGSVFNNCQCQCVPQGVAQPQCYRDCASACPDKVNQVWSWCTLGCIPKSAAYGDPGLLACPPLQASSTSVALYNPALNRLNPQGQQMGIMSAVS